MTYRAATVRERSGRARFPRSVKHSLELALRYASDAFRIVAAVQLGTRIYVLHAFQKKSKRGIATSQRDVDLIRKRYAEARELAREHEKAKRD